MKKKRTIKLSCERARAFPIENALAKLGHFPTKTNEKEAWFLSPFRSETQASFKVSKKLNRWYDHGEGKGGNVIDLICKINNSPVKETLRFLEQDTNSFSFHRQPLFKGQKPVEDKVNIIAVKSISHPALSGYIKSRRIDMEIVKSYSKEVHYTFKGKHFFAVGLRNDSGGWELRNKYIKSCTMSKDIKFIQNGYDRLVITEGMFDFFSILCHRPELKYKTDFLIMNSTVLIEKVMSVPKRYSSVELYLDNDQNGKRTSQKLMASSSNCVDMSMLYKKFKDMNEWLICKAKKGLGQGAQDVFLLPQKQSCFTPDSRKEKKK
ncbi:toprim domain-containing protein [Maribacter litoralis]|uniref:toprim domain-containing protein n=1 Tax=Maribacter litoralis TaxID=2059726 RepID=UPI003F5CDD76